MPMVVMSFVEDEQIRNILTGQAGKIADIVAEVLDYEPGEVAVKPEVLDPRDHALSHNLPQLEFNIVGGNRFAGDEQDKAEQIWGRLGAEIPQLHLIMFAVWLQSTTGAYVDSEH